MIIKIGKKCCQKRNYDIDEYWNNFSRIRSLYFGEIRGIFRSYNPTPSQF